MKNELEKYNKKRDFTKTSEPRGTKKKSATKKLIFVVQHHLARRDHYDFRLEWDGGLLSWAVPKGPSFNPKDKRLAVQTEVHPLDYADFEGYIPKGQYGGGSVMLWDNGTWESTIDDFEEGLKEGSLKFRLFGKRLKGNWALVRLRGEENENDDNWLLIKEKDEYSKDNDGISGFDTSIKTGRTSAEIEMDDNPLNKKNPFDKVEVELAQLMDKIPSGKDWLFEIKYDGYRIVTFCEDNKARLITRNNHDFTLKFKPIQKAIETWTNGRSCVLDGEIVVTDDNGKTDFQALQNYIKNPSDKVLSYMIFDILALDGEDLRDKPLIERKKILHQMMNNAPSNLVFSEHVLGNGKKCFEMADKMNLEGIIGKKVDSVYKGTRNENWIKIKCYKRQEFVVCGYTLSKKKKEGEGISSLILGVYEKSKLIFIGKTGTGFNSLDVKKLQKEFDKLTTEECPFEKSPKMKGEEKVFWLKPNLVAEIQYAELTDEKVLRQASFKGLRTDKSPKEIVLERTEARVENIDKKVSSSKRNTKDLVCGVKISNPDKIVFKDRKIKKIDVVKYYETVAERMMPFIEKRILSVVRCHGGVGANCFYKKHPNTESDGVKIIPVENAEGEKDDYFYVENKNGIVAEVQLGTIEFHIWGSKAPKIDRPDMMVFDLDPDENMGLEQIRQGVKDLKSVLDELSLKSFLKTSGGKGYHIVVPFKPTVSWDVFHDFAKNVAIAMESKWPDLYTSNIRKDSRKGKIFIDWVRNGKGATSVAPYSLRARKDACVSMPIKWSELDKISPNQIDMFEAVERLKKVDPWKGFFDVKQELK